MKLQNKVAIVTGAAGGLGQAIVNKLCSEGASVVVSDVNETLVHSVVDQFISRGYETVANVCDVSSKESVEKLVQAAVEKFGRIDILVNNAGGSLFTPKKLEEIEEEHWDRVLNVNLKGTFLCSQAVAPIMSSQQDGIIVNISSIGGRSASPVTGVAYAAAKSGIIGFSRRLALELGNSGVRVNTVAPGLIISGERMAQLYDELNDSEKQKILSSIPLNRLGTVEEQADVIAFLASNEARYITGAVIDVNGGRLMT